MTSYLIGRVVEPSVKDVKIKGESRSVLVMGLLCGRECISVDLFDDAKCFEKAITFEDGEEVIALVGVSLNRDEKQLRYFLNDIGECPEGFHQSLKAMMAEANS